MIHFDNIVDYENTIVGTKKATPQEWVSRFCVWACDNPEAIKAMYERAITFAMDRGYVSVNYLLEWLRYDSHIRIRSLEGYENDFKAPNTFATIFARYLVQDIRIKPCIRLNLSEYDTCYFPQIPWVPYGLEKGGPMAEIGLSVMSEEEFEAYKAMQAQARADAYRVRLPLKVEGVDVLFEITCDTYPIAERFKAWIERSAERNGWTVTKGAVIEDVIRAGFKEYK